MTFALALFIGVLAGLRSMTAPAGVAWGAHLGLLRLHRPLTFIGTAPAVGIMTVSAIVELVVDKLPNTPSRTALTGLLARIVTGGVSGACVGMAGADSPVFGAIAGIAGAVLGCFGGYQIRKRIVTSLGTRDLYIALIEDLVAIGGTLLVVSSV